MIENSNFKENSNNPSGNASSSGSVGGKCAICAAPSKSKCSNCTKIYYCSVNHQKQDWKRHKQECHPFIIKSDEKLGRYVVATRDINPDEIVLKESFLVYGPVKKCVCVGCMKQVDEDDLLECEHCGWPVCQRECQNCPDHKAECEYLAEVQNKEFNLWNIKILFGRCLNVLRCLVLKKTNPKKWERLIQLEAHEEQTDASDDWRQYILSYLTPIKEFFNWNEWPEDEIIKIIRILGINSLEIPLVEPSYAGIFDYASLFEHSCNPNTTIAFTDKKEIIIWAPYKIKKGTNLSVSYLDLQWDTVRRQRYLKNTKFFKCECERCKDVTEFGTFYNALRCNNKNCDGMVLPLSLETFDKDWKCKKCLKVMKKSYVSEILDKAEEEFEELDRNNIVHCMRYISDHTKYLPEHHYLIGNAKLCFVQSANEKKVLSTISNAKLSTALKFCKELIDLYSKLAPAGSANTVGHLCFMMHRILVEHSKRTNDRQSSEHHLKEALKYIKKTIKYLQYYSVKMLEGKICKEAKIIEASSENISLKSMELFI